MNPFVNTEIDHDRSHAALLFLRVIVCSLMFTHGIPKALTLLEGGDIHFADPIGLGPKLSLILAAFAETVCSLFILIGLGTRFAVIPLIINFSVITFVVHLWGPWKRMELPALFLAVFIALLILGPGKYSVDGLFAARWRRNSR